MNSSWESITIVLGIGIQEYSMLGWTNQLHLAVLCSEAWELMNKEENFPCLLTGMIACIYGFLLCASFLEHCIGYDVYLTSPKEAAHMRELPF